MISFNRVKNGEPAAAISYTWVLTREDLARLIIVALHPTAPEDLFDEHAKKFLKEVIRGQLSLHASKSWRWEELYSEERRGEVGDGAVTAEEAWEWGMEQAMRL